MGRHTYDNLCRLDTDIHRLDICHNSLILHETSTTATVRFTTVWLHSALCAASGTANTSTSGTILPQLWRACSARCDFLPSLRKTIAASVKIHPLFYFYFKHICFNTNLGCISKIQSTDKKPYHARFFSIRMDRGAPTGIRTRVFGSKGRNT